MLVAIGIALLAAWLVFIGLGAAPPQVWIGALTIAGWALIIAVLGTCLNKYHMRDETHAAKTMRPGMLLAMYITVLMIVDLAAGVLAERRHARAVDVRYQWHCDRSRVHVS